VTGHNPPGHNHSRSESPVQWQGRIKTQNHTSPIWKLNFRIGGRKPPGHNPLVQDPMLGLRRPILKFSFQNHLSCNIKRHRTLCFNSSGGSDLGGLCHRGFVRPCRWQRVLTQGYVRGVYVRQSGWTAKQITYANIDSRVFINLKLCSALQLRCLLCSSSTDPLMVRSRPVILE